MQLEKYLPDWLLNFRNEKTPRHPPVNLEDRVSGAIGAVREVLARTWIYVLAGIVVGAAIHGYVPDDFLSRVLARTPGIACPWPC